MEELNKKINLLIKNGDKQIINNYTLNEIYKTYNLFGYEIDKYILTEEQNKSLDNILLDISKESEIIIVGYSDTRGTDKYNLQLSYKRAKAVSEYLLNKGFLNIIVKSNGYNMLIEESKGEQFKNRRVELIVKEK
ncbi:OmpA family protein [Streptobacillus felis]|uniref:OmpA family protein n=1 Tax=Streptobacillus felis TaxID=1384509 RepID=A0A7Z0PFB4_9FUSO|nr:OmpA family protein [Streptobacillus felis]